MAKEKFYCFAAASVFCLLSLFSAMAQTDKFKVLVVMSYEDDFAWCREIREGIDDVLANTCDVRYFYLNTKTDFNGGKEKAKQAYALYEEFQPDGVIAADDDAQSMFVLPYLKDKVKIPVMFCGVNAEPEKYGYPASNISGILQRSHIRESVILAQQLVPSVRTIGYLMRDVPTSRAILKQIQDESATYPAKAVDFKLVKTMEEAVSVVTELKEQCDLLFNATLDGLLDKNNNPVPQKQAIQIVTKAFGKPTIAINTMQIKYGVLCAMVEKGQEQGAVSSDMLLKAMQGTPVSEIPITRNRKGKAVINVTEMKALGIKPDPAALHSAELVKTEE